MNPKIATAPMSLSLSTYSTRKSSARAKRETLARRQVRTVKYASAAVTFPSVRA